MTGFVQFWGAELLSGAFPLVSPSREADSEF